MNLFKLIFNNIINNLLLLIINFISDTIFVIIFGSGIVADAFFISFKLPNLFKKIFTELILPKTFIPILIEYKIKKQNKKIIKIISYIICLFILFFLFLTIFFSILTTYWIIIFIVPRFKDNYSKIELTIELLHKKFLYIFFISLTFLIGYILNIYYKLFSITYNYIILNISIIIFMLLTVSYFNPPINALAWSIIVGGLLQLIYNIKNVYFINIFIFPNFKFKNIFNYILYKFLPIIVTSFIIVYLNKRSYFLKNILYYFFISCSISWIYYSYKLIEFPIIILEIILKNIFKKYFSYIFFIFYILITIILLYLSNKIIFILLKYFNFSYFDFLMTKNSFLYYLFGLIVLIKLKIFIKLFYSSKDITTQLYCNILKKIIIKIINFLFICILQHTGFYLYRTLFYNVKSFFYF